MSVAPQGQSKEQFAVFISRKWQLEQAKSSRVKGFWSGVLMFSGKDVCSYLIILHLFYIKRAKNKCMR